MSDIPWRTGGGCEFCESLVECQNWCISKSEAVRYAYVLILYPWKMSTADEIRMRGMGITYGLDKCLTDGNEDK
jgi:hypothetical protein